MLVESGIDEIKKNLHPKNDAALIQSLDLTVNMIKSLDLSRGGHVLKTLSFHPYTEIKNS